MCVHVLPGCQLVLLLAGPWSGSQWQLTHWGQVTDHLVQFSELGANLQQLARIGSQVFYVCSARLLQHVLPFMTKAKKKKDEAHVQFNNHKTFNCMSTSKISSSFFPLPNPITVRSISFQTIT